MNTSLPRISGGTQWIFVWYAEPTAVLTIETMDQDPPDLTMPYALRSDNEYLGFAFPRKYWDERRAKDWCQRIGMDVVDVMNLLYTASQSSDETGESYEPF